jgi:hypothetical protein
MQFNDFEKNIIFEYWKTLKRKNISNISYNNFIKKPYLEKYIINLSVIIDNNTLLKNIKEVIDNEVSNEDLILFISNNIELDKDEKKNIEKIIFKNELTVNNKDNKDNINNKDNKNEQLIFNELSIQIIYYQVKYFRFYQTIIELLFNNNKEDNELYNFIYVYIKNNSNDIRIYCKKNINFLLFYNYIDQLFNLYLNIFNILSKNNLINNQYTDKEIHHLFIKNIFNNWYNIYKNDILEKKFDEKCKPYKFKTNILSRILCLPNI